MVESQSSYLLDMFGR